jgi:hypothetical protein
MQCNEIHETRTGQVIDLNWTTLKLKYINIKEKLKYPQVEDNCYIVAGY